MRFLIIQKLNQGIPIQRLTKLIPAQMKYIRELMQKKKIELYYHMIGQEGHVVICEVRSDEELSEIVGDDPLFFESRREISKLTI
ncbi:MAG: hypothetical protein V1857_06895 [archaeon]